MLFEDDNTAVIGLYGVVFDGYFEGKDIVGEHFHTGTDFKLKRAKGAPVHIDHTGESYVKYNGQEYLLKGIKGEVGEIIEVSPDDIGLYMQLQFEKSNEYWGLVEAMYNSGRMGASTGSDHRVQKSADGRIDIWPINEVSLTLTPAEPRTTENVSRLKSQSHDELIFKRNGETITISIEPEYILDNAVTTKTSELTEITEESAEEEQEETNVSAIQSDNSGESESMQEEAELSATEGEQEATPQQLEVSEMTTETATPEVEETKDFDFKSAFGELNQNINDKFKSLEERVTAIEDEPAEKITLKAQTVNYSNPKIDPSLAKGGTVLQNAVKSILAGKYKSVTFNAKALSEGTDSAGGYLVDPEYSNELIEILTAGSVMRRAGARVMPMMNDTLQVPRQTGGATAYWVGENASITTSDQTFNQLEIVAKKLAGLTVMSRELFVDSDPAVEAIVQEDLRRVLDEAEDIGFIRGDGSGSSPTGVKNITGVTSTSKGTNGGALGFDDLRAMIYRLNAANAPQDNRAFIMHPRELDHLYSLKINNEDNHYAFAMPQDAVSPPRVYGVPVFTTTQIPINLTVGTSTDTSEVYLGAMREAIIGQRQSITIEASMEAGNAFQNDQVMIRAITRVGFGLRHTESFEVLTGTRAV